MEEKSQFNAEVRRRTTCMSAETRNLLVKTQILPIDRPLVNQLIRCSYSLTANYRAATRTRSDAEFYSKISIVVEESDETLFWMEYLVTLGVVDEKATAGLRSEIDQLVRLFSTIRKRMKEKVELAGRGAQTTSAKCHVPYILDLALDTWHLTLEPVHCTDQLSNFSLIEDFTKVVDFIDDFEQL